MIWKNGQETLRDGFKWKRKANLYDQYIGLLTELSIASCFLVDSIEMTADLFHFTFARKSDTYFQVF